MGELSSQAVGTSSGSGNSSLTVGMPYAFYSQQSSPKLDAPSAITDLHSSGSGNTFHWQWELSPGCGNALCILFPTRGIVIRNKTRLVAQGHTQEEGIDYEEGFAPVERIEAIRLFLAYASYIGFIVYQMDVKSAFLYETIDVEVYVMQPLGFQDPEFPHRVYKVEKAMYGLYQAPRAWYGTLSKYLLDNGFQIAKTPMGRENPWGKDETGKDVELHLYRSMIRSLMYLTASRLDIMFDLCACARHQVAPKECHLYVVKRIFRYLKDLLPKAFDVGRFQYLVGLLWLCIRINGKLNEFWIGLELGYISSFWTVGDYAYACLDGSMAWISKDLKT
nr:putative ribonuclease H-like domain-containing protein [Tanacetum cinerariifolium]